MAKISDVEEKMKIFYADDDQDEIEIFCEILSSINPSIECVTADNGESALKILQQISLPDFILLDMNMPRMSGSECLRLIKKDERLKAIPVVIYSTSFDQREISAWYQNGAHHVIRKQSDIAMLRAELKLVLMITSV